MLSNYQPEEQADPYLFEKYDSQQVQDRIEQADATLTTGIGIAQGLLLAGVQSVTVQSLYAIGTVGFYPLAVSCIPVVVAFGATITTITIDNGLSISDLGKFGAGVARSSVLAASGLKLYFDNQKVDMVAKIGISTIKSQLDTYEKRPEKSGLSNGLIILIAVCAVAAIVSTFRRKK